MTYQGASARVETPPRMRGRPSVYAQRIKHHRNTPAYAGKTVQQAVKRQLPQKHPRVCGEDSTLPTNEVVRPETPPRMRGRLRVSKIKE